MIAATTRCLPSVTARRVPARVGVVRFPQRPAAVTSAAGAASPGGNGSTSPRPARAQALARPFDAPLPVAALLDDKAAAAEALRAGYYRLFRGWNALPSLCLVLLGAWTGAGKTVLALQHLTVWFMGAASACVALASCAINDYFDWKIDAVNDASKPIPSGLITPDRALLVSASAYICLLALTCIVPNTGVRLIIAASAATTLLYTPLIKRHLLAKNLVVASTIAVAPLAGALAAGAAGPGLRAVLAPSAFLFLGIMHREIMMDIQDRQGDAEAGVRTLPVVLGPHAALSTCAGLLAACAVLAAHSALLGTGLSWAWAANASLEAPLRAAMLAAVAGVMYGPAAAALRVLRSSFDRGEVASAVSKSMGSIAAGTLLLALLV